jgi:hypothetical protein
MYRTSDLEIAAVIFSDATDFNQKYAGEDQEFASSVFDRRAPQRRGAKTSS